ncbi:MAG: hypothetical protein AAF944_07850 [Bacteroidota bacterium]
MIYKFLLILAWSVFTLTPMLSKAQLISSQLGSHADGQVDEQVYLQLSESIVGAGESMWFQAYITNADSAAALSRVVYLELFNQQQATVVQGIYPASFGIATGELAVPDSLAGGWYQLRAYTQYMRNGYVSNFFTQPILVVNSNLDNPSPEVQPNRPAFALRPEGGNWVANRENKVVVTYTGNKSDTVQLEVIQASDSTIVNQSIFTGQLSSFTFTPQADSSYLARLITTDTSYIPLPEAREYSSALQVSFADGGLIVKGTNPPGEEKYHLAIRSRTHILYHQPLNPGEFSLILPMTNLQGLLEMAILDNQQEARVQRMIYADRQEDYLSLNLSRAVISPREALSIALTKNSDLSDATLSLTVRKSHFPKPPLSVATLAHFGLSSIQLPDGVSPPQANSWINQWLVTQTSDWLSWSDMFAQEPTTSTFTQEDEMLLITGQVQVPQSRDEEDRILLSIPGDDPYFEYSKITEDGGFAIPISRVYGLQNSILQYNSATDDQPQRLQWKVDNTFAPPPERKFTTPYSIADNDWQRLVNSYQLRKQIQQGYYSIDEDTTVSASKIKKQFRFYGAPNVRVNPNDYISLPSFEEICRELLPGVRLIKKKGKYDFDVFDPGSRSFLPNEPTLFLDGVPIQEKAYIIDFPPSEISFIETVNRRTYYGNVRLDGVVAVYTKQEKAYEEALAGKAHFTSIPYYTSSAPFLLPDSLAVSSPDFRTLLYWKPKISLGDNNATFSVITADELGTYEVIVQGLTKQGKTVYEKAIFEVKHSVLP